jgi:queuine tRNA-ribosyltransferase
VLATTHNIAYYKGLAENARKAILEDRFLEFKKDFFANYTKDSGDDDGSADD